MQKHENLAGAIGINHAIPEKSRENSVIMVNYFFGVIIAPDKAEVKRRKKKRQMRTPKSTLVNKGFII